MRLILPLATIVLSLLGISNAYAAKPNCGFYDIHTESEKVRFSYNVRANKCPFFGAVARVKVCVTSVKADQHSCQDSNPTHAYRKHGNGGSQGGGTDLSVKYLTPGTKYYVKGYIKLNDGSYTPTYSTTTVTLSDDVVNEVDVIGPTSNQVGLVYRYSNRWSENLDTVYADIYANGQLLHRALPMTKQVNDQGVFTGNVTVNLHSAFYRWQADVYAIHNSGNRHNIKTVWWLNR